jgi:hypothetical protein
MLLTLAFPDFRSQAGFARWVEGPASRRALVVVFETEPIEKTKGIPLPDYSPTADLISAYLAVLFGKRFDSHGLLEGIGYFHVPDLAQYSTLCDHSLPQNSNKPRVDFAVPLNLSEVARFGPLLLDGTFDVRFLETFRAAVKYYSQSLQIFERDAEIAYLHLITAGEILSGFYEYADDVLMDEDTAQALTRIREDLADGDRIVRILTGQLRRLKRRFVETLVRLTDQSFFERSESSEDWGRFSPTAFRDSISAAYDLRSTYVHTGNPFGEWVALRPGGVNAEVPVGKPVLADKALAKTLGRAPTYVGLERVLRYCLLRFAEEQGALVDEPIIAGGSPQRV